MRLLCRTFTLYRLLEEQSTSLMGPSGALPSFVELSPGPLGSWTLIWDPVGRVGPGRPWPTCTQLPTNLGPFRAH